MCESDDTRFFVYLHRRKTDNKVFYVGKGTGNRATKTQSRNAHWHNVARKHGWFCEVVFCGLSSKEALDLEKDTILEMLYFSQPLTNKNAGGTGFSGWRTPEDVRKKISEAARASFTAEKRAAYSRMLSGRIVRPVSREKISRSKRCEKLHKWVNVASGEVVEMTQYDFRQAFGLSQAQTTDLARGAGSERGGWKIMGTESRSEKDRMTLVDTKSGKVFSASRIELCANHGVESSDCSRLFSGKKITAKGFALLSRIDEFMSVSRQIELGFLLEVKANGAVHLIRSNRE